MLFPEFISQTFSKQLDALYPASRLDQSFRRFLMYLAFGSWVDHHHRYLRVSQEVCAILEKRPLNGHYCANHYLTKMHKQLPEMKISGWQYNGVEQELSELQTDKEHCRLVLHKGLSTAFLQAITDEQQGQYPKSDKIHYLTGNKYTKNIATAILKQEEELVHNINAPITKTQLQQQFIDYFNTLPSQTFTQLLKHNYDTTLALFHSFPFINPETKEHNLKLLETIQQQPKPFYQAVPDCRRLYAVGNAIPYLKKELRKELTKGWIEFDLVNCHLAIIAKDWNIPSLFKQLQEGSMWSYLATTYDVALYKAVLKKALYALVYGDSKAEIERNLQKASLPKRSKFFKLPLIHDIYQAREHQLQEVKHYNDARIDCFGEELAYVRKWHTTPTGQQYYTDNSRSILAQKAYAIELKMLQPILEYSSHSKYICLISLYQFDGFSMACKQKSRERHHINKICNILNAHIQSMGYPTKVEYTINGEEHVSLS